MPNKHELWELHQRQALPLNAKIAMTKVRIREWVNYFGQSGVYVSFSGGKDSTVLLDLVRQEYPNVKAVFVDTGLEFPEIREFVKTFDNVDWIKPKMTFKQVIEKYGYPFISKEVAECVYGARKYLTRVLEEANAPNRQTDRQTDRRLPYAYRLEKLCGYGKFEEPNWGGTTTSTENSVESVCIPVEKTHSNREIYGKRSNKQTNLNPAVVDKSRDLVNLLGSERLTVALTHDSGKTIDNLRIQRLMGINNKTGKAKTMEDIPSEKDRSPYACTRYQFFLDAPFEISNSCCNAMKKSPVASYHRQTGRVPMTAQMASESRLRTQIWLKQGCNAFDSKKQVSNPMSFWTEQDVLHYIYRNKLPIASVYGDVIIDNSRNNNLDGQMTFNDVESWGNAGIFDLEVPTFKVTGYKRTGCMFCGFGCHLDKPGEGRFERMKVTHPKLYDYIMRPKEEGGLNYKEVIDWINENGGLHIRY